MDSSEMSLYRFLVCPGKVTVVTVFQGVENTSLYVFVCLVYFKGKQVHGRHCT